MLPDETPAPREPSWPWWRWALTALSALGFVLSCYLSWHALRGGSVIGCGGGSGCDQVLSSRWSSVGGIMPVSGLAAGAYLALLVAGLFVGPNIPEADRRLAWGAILLLAGAAAGSAVWFIIVQKWIVHAFCPYCMATHITGLLLAALVLWRGPRGWLRCLSPALGLLLAGILAACQIAFAPRAVFLNGESTSALPAVEPRAVPLIGSASAPSIITLLFDYECPHCQHVHSMLQEVISRYHGKVAFVLCPAPLNNQCNPYISRQVEAFRDSCDLAKLGLAVWVARREAFSSFDDWMYSGDPGQPWRPRSLDAARAKAVALVGEKELDTALADPWVGRFLQASVRIYGNTVGPHESGNAVPKLVFGTRWITPEPADTEDFISILQEGLGVPKP